MTLDNCMAQVRAAIMNSSNTATHEIVDIKTLTGSEVENLLNYAITECDNNDAGIIGIVTDGEGVKKIFGPVNSETRGLKYNGIDISRGDVDFDHMQFNIKKLP